MTTLSINASNGFKPHFIKKRVTEQLSHTSKQPQGKKKRQKKNRVSTESQSVRSHRSFYSTTLALQIKFFFQNFYPACLLKLNMVFPKPLFFLTWINVVKCSQCGVDLKMQDTQNYTL